VVSRESPRELLVIFRPRWGVRDLDDFLIDQYNVDQVQSETGFVSLGPDD